MLALLTLTACGPDGTPDDRPLIVKSFVRYLANPGELKSQLSAFEGEDLSVAESVEFVRDVRFDGATMRQRDLPGDTHRYEHYRRDAAWRSPMQFTLPDEQDRPLLTFEIGMSPPDIGRFPTRIDRAAGVSFTAGPALGEDESLLLFFTDSASQARQVLIAGPSRDSVLRAPAPSLQNLQPGTHRLYLVKKQRREFSKGSARITSTIEYYTDEIEVEVE